MTTEFEKWLSEWPSSTGPPLSAQRKLSRRLVYNGNWLLSRPRSIRRRPLSPRVELDNANIVSWKGISLKNFRTTFLQDPCIQRVVKFGCQMWFVRSMIIPELLNKLKLPAGPLVDHYEGGANDASIFLSYTGSYTLQDMIDITSDLEDDESAWVDVFCVNQVAWTQRKDSQMEAFKKQFTTQLYDRIGAIGKTALLLDRWNAPMTPLGKVWVLWEVFSAVDQGDLRILMRPTEKERFLMEGFISDEVFSQIEDSVYAVDVRKATAWTKNDRDYTFDSMKHRKGVSAVNRVVTRKLQEWLLATARKLYEESSANHEFQLILGNNLGLLMKRMGSTEEAELMYRSVLEQATRLLGRDHDTTATCAHGLSILVMAKGEFKESEGLLLMALHSRRRSLGQKHPFTLSTLFYIAALHNECSDIDGSEIIMRHVVYTGLQALGNCDEMLFPWIKSLATALEMQMRRNGPRHTLDHSVPPTLQDILQVERVPSNRDILSLMVEQQLLERNLTVVGMTESLYDHCWKANESLFGSNHPSTLAAANNLATFFANQGNWVRATTIHRHLVDNARELGEIGPSYYVYTNNLAGDLRAQGDLVGAESLYIETVEGRTKLYGKSDGRTLHSVSELMDLYRDQGRLADAKPLFSRWYVDKLDVDHELNNIVHVSNYGRLLHQLGELQDAERLYREALDASRQTNHPQKDIFMNNVAVIMRDQGKHDAAAERFAALDEKESDVTSPTSRRIQYHNAFLLELQGDLEAAEEKYHLCFERGCDLDFVSLRCLHNLGLLALNRGDRNVSVSFLTRARDGKRQSLGENDPETLATKFALIPVQMRLDNDLVRAKEMMVQWKVMEGHVRTYWNDHERVKALTHVMDVLESPIESGLSSPSLAHATDGLVRCY